MTFSPKALPASFDALLQLNSLQNDSKKHLTTAPVTSRIALETKKNIQLLVKKSPSFFYYKHHLIPSTTTILQIYIFHPHIFLSDFLLRNVSRQIGHRQLQLMLIS
jgi:hypothetical protein